jgi:hypothetical protein
VHPPDLDILFGQDREKHLDFLAEFDGFSSRLADGDDGLDDLGFGAFTRVIALAEHGYFIVKSIGLYMRKAVVCFEVVN